MNGIMKPEKLYKEMYIDSSELLIPRDLYQRTLNHARVREIAENFDERVANEPKVSARDGGFYVFDGQHTVAARKLLNNGMDLPVLCKVYSGLTAQDEALLFAQQTGFAAKVYPGAKSARWCLPVKRRPPPLRRQPAAPACGSPITRPEGRTA